MLLSGKMLQLWSKIHEAIKSLKFSPKVFAILEFQTLFVCLTNIPFEIT
jgi:hypothetical protein